MPDSESPEFAALNELEAVVRHVCDELATWRRRAQKAEGDKPGGGRDRAHDGAGSDADNVELRRRIDATRGRMEDLLKRLRFLEEQASVQEVR